MRSHYPIYAESVSRDISSDEQVLGPLSDTLWRMRKVPRAAIAERPLQSVASVQEELPLDLEALQLQSDVAKIRPTHAPEQMEQLQAAADLVLCYTAADRKHTSWQHYQRLLAGTCSVVSGRLQEHWEQLEVPQLLHVYLVLTT